MPRIEPATSLAPFASPDHFDPELQAFLHEASSILCKWFGEASERGPLPSKVILPEVAPPLFGLSGKQLLEELQLVMEGAFQPSHPGSLAHLDPPPLTASIAADLICAGLNNNLLAEELSPSLTSLERQICRWFAECIGLPIQAGGIAASGGSLSNLMALALARAQVKTQSCQSAVVLASEDSHTSLLKAVRIMGLPDDALRLLPTNPDGQIILETLKELLIKLKAQGQQCFALVATAGTTVRGAVDPLCELAEICMSEGIWLHVDGAIGGIFAIDKKTSSAVSGIGMADSITLNPQKVLGIAKTSSLLLVADQSKLLSTFGTGLTYMEPPWGDAHRGEMGLQGSRSAEVLKLWLGLRQLGENGIKLLLQGAIDRRKYLQEKLDQSSFDILSGPLHLFAFSPKGLTKDEAFLWSKSTRKKLLENQFMLSRPFHQNHFYLKVVLGNPNTTDDHLNKLAILLNKSLHDYH